jgi:hypothetical protein
MRRRLASVVLVVAATTGALVVATGVAHADSQEDAARKLVAYVPKDERNKCSIQDPTKTFPPVVAEAASVSARLDCGPDGDAQQLTYFQFTNADAMNRAYTGMSAGTVGKPYRSEEGKCPGEQTWGFNNGDDGRVACDYSTSTISGDPIAETVYRVWTYDRANILAFASAPVGNVDAVALRKWWLNNAGPLEEAGTVTGLAQPSTVSTHDAEQRLLKHVPKSMRKSCAAIPRQQIDNRFPTFYQDRLWANAAVSCTPTKPGAQLVSYVDVDPAVIDGYFATYVPPESTRSGDCPDFGTYHQGKGSKRRLVGQYSCYFSTNVGGAKVASYAWSDRKLGIIAIATNSTADATALKKWWEGSESGPEH